MPFRELDVMPGTTDLRPSASMPDLDASCETVDRSFDGTSVGGGLSAISPEPSALQSGVDGYLSLMDEDLTKLENALADGGPQEIGCKIAASILNTMGWLNAWMDYLYKHSGYQSTKKLREDGLSGILSMRNPENVTNGIALMREFIAKVRILDFNEAREATEMERNPKTA